MKTNQTSFFLTEQTQSSNCSNKSEQHYEIYENKSNKFVTEQTQSSNCSNKLNNIMKFMKRNQTVERNKKTSENQ